MPPTLAIVVSIASVILSINVSSADPQTDSGMTELGPMPPKGTAIIVSADGLHTGFMAAAGSRQVVLHDGKPGPEFDEIAHYHADTTSGMINAIVLSRDGSRIAYPGRRGKSRFVCVDGHEGPRYTQLPGELPSLGLFVNSGEFGFTADGKHVVYVAASSDDGWHVVADGVESSAYKQVEPIVFSEKGGRFAYLATTPDGAAVVAVDGKQAETYASIDKLQFSPDGDHCAFIARMSDTKWHFVMDGKVGSGYESIDQCTVGENGTYCYRALKTQEKDTKNGRLFKRYVIVLNGNESPESEATDYPAIDKLQLSSDGRKIAYISRTPDGDVVVFDGKSGQNYDHIDNLIISPGGFKVAYLASTPNGKFLVVDERESMACADIKGFVFSEDGRHFGYAGWADQHWIMVVDWKMGKSYNEVSDLLMSKDGAHYAYAASTGSEAVLVIDGKERPMSYLSGLNWPNQANHHQQRFAFSPDGRHFAYAAQTVAGSGKLAVIVDGVAGPTIDGCLKFAFSPDSRHFAYAALANQKSFVVLDQKPIRTIELLDDGRSGWTNANSFLFREDGSLRYLAVKDNRIYSVSETPGASSITESQGSVDFSQQELQSEENIPPNNSPNPANGNNVAAVKKFIKGFWNHHGDNDLNDWASDFADRVKYCYSPSNQPADQQFISRDRGELISKYPTRQYRFYDLIVRMRLDSSSADVTYTFNYSYTGRKLATGVCRVSLTVQQISGRWVITSYDEKVVRR
jgi:uncharacterized protein YfaP (DUF2135 family)